MRYSFHLSIVAAVSALCFSCTDYKEADAPETLVVDATQLSFPASGSSHSVSVQSGTKWSVGSKPDWLTVPSISSSGSFQWNVTFTAAENNEYDREGSMSITSSSGSASIKLNQAGKKGKYVAVESVTVNPESLSMTEGEKAKLTATVSPSSASVKTVTWRSGNESLVKVDQDGNVTAVMQGSTSINATSDDGGKVGVCSVTVKSKVISVTGVTLDKTSMTLTEGETGTLAATVTPANATDKSVSWVSSNTSVATVSSTGVVTAVAPGTAAVTVQTNDGAKIASCVVTVKSKSVSVTGVSLNYTTLTLTEGQTQTLTATVSPSNATNKSVTWSSSNTSVATVSSTGVVTAVKAGTATITVKTNDGSKTATCTVTVKSKDVSGGGNEGTSEEDLF